MFELAGSIGSAVSPVLQLAEWLAAPICRQFKYFYNYSTNVENLEEGVRKLETQREKVRPKIDRAKRNVEEIRESVENWQTGVEKIISDVKQLIGEKADNPRCLKGLCPNFVSHYKQSKKALKLKDDIDKLVEQEKELDPVSFPTKPPENWLRSGVDYLAFESRNSIEKNVRDALKDKNVYMIGVYGMGGLGKTTLVWEFAREAEEKKLFDEIVFVEVSKPPDVENIQTKIAEKLGLEFEKESERADRLFSRMKNRKILLILDNIWKDPDLRKIGIPTKDDDRRGNKLLFTSRNLDVLKKMGCTNNFQMDILNPKDAWTLFSKMAGNVSQTPKLISLAKEVCQNCGRSPIIICTIANDLKTKSYPSRWEAVLKELKDPPATFMGVLEEVHKEIALSYCNLKDDELKETFLISSLMENNSSILDLLKHVVCLNILKGFNFTMEDTRNKLDTFIHDLKDACLLIDGHESGQFAMYDVVRVVATKIAYVDHHVFTMRNDIEGEWKNRDNLNRCKKISLLNGSTILSQFCQIGADNLYCPNLEYLYMPNSPFKIPEDFFTEMPKLKVLNLVGLKHSSLPSSINPLTNLQTLCLDRSKIKDFTTIEKLTTLKVLSLQDLDIVELPKALGQLTQLRLLDLSKCQKLEEIAPNVISRLSQLEEFYIKGCRIKWKHRVLQEFKRLSKLTSLELDIKDDKVLLKDFFPKKLKRYKISIGDWQWSHLRSDERESSKRLEIELNSTISLEKLPGIESVEVLCIDDANRDITHMKPLFDNKGIRTDLKGLALLNMKYRKVWDNQFLTSTIQKLTYLSFYKCSEIKYVFPFSIIKSLQQLQYLEIRDCEVLEKIVKGAKVVKSLFPQVTKLKLINLPRLTVFYPRIPASELPMLKALEIHDCPLFTSRYGEIQDYNEEGGLDMSKFFRLEHKINPDLEVLTLTGGSIDITWQSQSKALGISHHSSPSIPLGLLQIFGTLKELKLYYCAYKEIESLPGLPNLEVLHVEHCNGLPSLMPSSTSFQNLKVLTVSDCNGLFNLITPSTAGSLVELRELRISRCEKLTELVKNEGDVTTSTEIVFQNLNMLSFQNLECLKGFCSKNYSFNFSSLKELNIDGCPKIETFLCAILRTAKLCKVTYTRSATQTLTHHQTL